ncbi:MAG: IclR family transcriptional regulator C-terminal domain-containing protein [Oscillospiraceae bacterium]|nr:IclR family transcriptional regulator C-terminal domain-containing protein [Oscillospiraceae bacterium]
MHCTSCGKAMLSQMPTEQVEAIIKKHGLPYITANTFTNYDAFFEELARCRARGYAIDNEEETVGVKCIAVAIRTSRGNVAGAMSISGSVLTMQNELNDKYAALLSRACNALSPYANLFPAIQLLDSSGQPC